MSDKIGAPPPIGTPSTSGSTGPADPRTADSRGSAKIKLPAKTSATVDADISLETASAQILALRNQATAAAASGDIASLQQLTVHAVAIGVAAGQKAESLASTIFARFAAAGASSAAGPQKPGEGAANLTAPNLTATNLTALGLKPEEIARLFKDGAADAAASPAGSVASGLQALTALNTKAGAVITDARNLLASINSDLKTGSPGTTASTTSTADQDLALHSLAQLLDQTESSLNARIYAAGQQLGGAPGKATSNDQPQPTPAIDLKT